MSLTNAPNNGAVDSADLTNRLEDVVLHHNPDAPAPAPAPGNSAPSMVASPTSAELTSDSSSASESGSDTSDTDTSPDSEFYASYHRHLIRLSIGEANRTLGFLGPSRKKVPPAVAFLNKLDWDEMIRIGEYVHLPLKAAIEKVSSGPR
jgi:hypothetical protein